MQVVEAMTRLKKQNKTIRQTTKPVVAESTTWYTVDEEALLSSAQLSNTKSSKKTTYDKGNDCRIVSIVKKKKPL